MADIMSMIGKDVEVIANGMVYRGILIEVSDIEVNLKTSMQWISLPVQNVSTIKPAGPQPGLERLDDSGGAANYVVGENGD